MAAIVMSPDVTSHPEI